MKTNVLKEGNLLKYTGKGFHGFNDSEQLRDLVNYIYGAKKS